MGIENKNNMVEVNIPLPALMKKWVKPINKENFYIVFENSSRYSSSSTYIKIYRRLKTEELKVILKN